MILPLKPGVVLFEKSKTKYICVYVEEKDTDKDTDVVTEALERPHKGAVDIF